MDGVGTVPRWAVTEPALSGLAGVEDIAGAVARCGDPARVDEVMGAVVRLAARDGGDDPDAVLLLVHLLSDGVLALAGRLSGLGGDLVSVIVAELTCQIRSFPWRRRTRAYAANLLLDTKHVLWEEAAHRRVSSREELIDPQCWQGRELGDRIEPGEGGGEDLDLIDVLMWAARTGVAPAGDLVLLLQSERVPAGPGRHAVAREFGLHERALRRRRSRTLAVLRAASDRYLQVA